MSVNAWVLLVYSPKRCLYEILLHEHAATSIARECTEGLAIVLGGIPQHVTSTRMPPAI